MRRGQLLVSVMGVVLLAAACSTGPDYRYIESDDGHLYGKIPVDWEVEREGAITYSLLVDLDSVQLAFTRDDDTLPWQADFAAPGKAGEVPVGSFQTQHIDARVRGEFRLYDLIDGQITELRGQGFDVTDFERDPVHMDGLVGYRVGYRVADDSSEAQYDQVYLVDERRAGLYLATVVCEVECHMKYADQIDEILTTFKVEP